MSNIEWVLVLAMGVFAMSGGKGQVMARGIRNNNPGNIRINSANNWLGKVPIEKNTDGEFEQFESSKYGIRALARLLTTYRKSGFDNIEKIINRYAPSTENHTKNYVAFVEGQTGIPRWQTLYDLNIPSVVKAIIHMENGSVPYSDSQIRSAVMMGM